jgi:hypothetical protein
MKSNGPTPWNPGNINISGEAGEAQIRTNPSGRRGPCGKDMAEKVAALG